jgi:hypothetical protein
MGIFSVPDKKVCLRLLRTIFRFFFFLLGPMKLRLQLPPEETVLSSSPTRRGTIEPSHSAASPSPRSGLNHSPGRASTSPRLNLKAIGKYFLLRKLGTGAYSEVWKARNIMTGAEVAVKLMKNNEDSAVMRRHIRRELEIAPVLKHPNIVETYEINEMCDDVMLVMQLAEVSGSPFVCFFFFFFCIY